MPEKQQYKEPPAALKKALDDHHNWLEGKGGAQLTDETLGDCTFKGLRLDGRRLSKIKLSELSSFVECSLVGVDFSDSVLDGVLVRRCDIRNTIYDGSCLRRSLFRENLNAETASFKNADIALADIPGLTCRRDAVELIGILLREP